MTTFEDRQKCLFDHLNAAEKNVSQSRLQNNEFKRPLFEQDVHVARKRVKSEMKQFRGKESIFKRPEAPLSQCLRLKNKATRKKNPNKWTYYNLEHITDEDMSDKTNTATGLAFMKEMEERARNKDLPNVDEMDADTEQCYGKPIFKQPSAFKITSSRKNNIKTSVSSTTIENDKSPPVKPRLDHLFEDFED